MNILLIPGIHDIRAPTEFCDLTLDDDPEPHWSTIGFEAPPAKRVKTSHEPSPQPPRPIFFTDAEKKTIINTQVVPIIVREITSHGGSFRKGTLALEVRASPDPARLAPNDLHDQILRQVIVSAEFDAEIEHGSGQLSQHSVNLLTTRIKNVVRQGTNLEQYKVQGTESPAPSPSRIPSAPIVLPSASPSPAPLARPLTPKPPPAPLARPLVPKPLPAPVPTPSESIIQTRVSVSAAPLSRQSTPQQLPVPVPTPSEPIIRTRVSTAPTSRLSSTPQPPPSNKLSNGLPRQDDADDELDSVAQPSSPVRQPPPMSRVETPPRTHRKRLSTATSPENYRSRARALALKSKPQTTLATSVEPGSSDNLYFQTQSRRPYLPTEEREHISHGSEYLQRRSRAYALVKPHVFHVDFSAAEIAHLDTLASSVTGKDGVHDQNRKSHRALTNLIKSKKRDRYINQLLDLFKPSDLPGRLDQDIHNFLHDLRKGAVTSEPQLLALEKDDFDTHGETLRASRVQSLLLAREISGNRGYGAMRTYVNFQNEFRKWREDGLELRTEWTNCAGDITTITWTSNEAFICGTTVHSDARNQQYNKFGNLVLGSTKKGTLKAYADHRVVRPVITEGENSTEAMRQSQDPWLYSSVVSSDYDIAHNRAYSSGFDKTVKIWEVDATGSSMTATGTWPHTGNVNFVAASKFDGDEDFVEDDIDDEVVEMVATAADTPVDAVRIYKVNPNNPSASTFTSFSNSLLDEEGKPIQTDKWAYFPAAMRLGLSRNCRRLILVGYSPRTLEQGDDNDIPENRLDSGEICVWDAKSGKPWKIIGSTKQNVFEVAWHPSQDCFIAATSRVKRLGEVRSASGTQVRIFQKNWREDAESGFKGFVFSEVRKLDCVANDINELTIKPNSFGASYIAAGCTDHNTYVWDSGIKDTDEPIHVLRHGRIIEEDSGNVISVEDTGVKFIAWGSSPDRFYTGSSDGVVKLWNIRSGGSPIVRDILECPAPVSFGAFSPDLSKLVIGDASGRVFLLSIDDDSDPGAYAAPFREVRLPNGTTRTVRQPKTFIPPAEPPPPTHDALGNPIKPQELPGIEGARAFLAANQLRIHKNRLIGAVQGPRYAETGIYNRAARVGDDPERPLLAGDEARQLENRLAFSDSTSWPVRNVEPGPESEKQHIDNVVRGSRAMEFDMDSLEQTTRQHLEAERAEVNVDFCFTYEDLPEEM